MDRKKYYGVINDIRLKGYRPKEKLPSEKDDLYDGEKPDVLIIGGGLTGCAAARELSRYRLNIMLVEKGADVAAGQSSRNGGAVHVGINYSPSSQKNYFNYRGNIMYSRLSKELDFPFERTGHLAHRSKMGENFAEAFGDEFKTASYPGGEIFKQRAIVKNRTLCSVMGLRRFIYADGRFYIALQSQCCAGGKRCVQRCENLSEYGGSGHGDKRWGNLFSENKQGDDLSEACHQCGGCICGRHCRDGGGPDIHHSSEKGNRYHFR